MRKMGLWVSIPDESWVTVWVEPAGEDSDPSFTADGVFHRSQGGDDELLDLHLGARRRKLRSPVNYSVLVEVEFAGDAEAVAVVEVARPDGSLHPEAFSGAGTFRSSVLRGSAGDREQVNLILATEAGEGGDL